MQRTTAPSLPPVQPSLSPAASGSPRQGTDAIEEESLAANAIEGSDDSSAPQALGPAPMPPHGVLPSIASVPGGQSSVSTQQVAQQDGQPGQPVRRLPIIHSFVSARGNMKKAAEMAGMTEADLALRLVDEPAELGKAIRAISLIEEFKLAHETRLMLRGVLEEMRPEDLVKLHIGTVQAIERMANSGVGSAGLGALQGATFNFGGTHNTLEAKVIEQLPPRVQAAVARLGLDANNLPATMASLASGQELPTTAPIEGDYRPVPSGITRPDGWPDAES